MAFGLQEDGGAGNFRELTQVSDRDARAQSTRLQSESRRE